MRRPKASSLFITHSPEGALAHADRITILRDGAMIKAGLAAEFDHILLWL